MAGYSADKPFQPVLKVLHVIGSLDIGGAEIVLERIVLATRRRGVDSLVVSLTSIGPVGQRLLAQGVKVIALDAHANSLLSLVGAATRLKSLLRKEQPDLVQTWLYHADFLGGLIAHLSGIKAIVWSVHSTDLAHGTSRTTRWLRGLLARLSSRIPTRILYVADAARSVHEGLGYAKAVGRVIHNGFDVQVFKPDGDSRARVRRELGIADHTLLIGSFGRFNLDKDHQTFLKAAKLLLDQHPDTQFLLAGSGVSMDNKEMAAMVNELELPISAFHLLGQRDDVPNLMRAIDVYCLHSRSEAFPLALGEAMASGAVPITTDVGDASLLVKGVSTPVKAEDPHALFDALSGQASEPMASLRKRGQLARQRIVDEFCFDKMVQEYMTCYQSLQPENC